MTIRVRQTPSSRVGGITWIVLLLLSATACRSGVTSPEAQVRATIERAETLAETRDLGGLKNLVSDAYHDDGGQDKRAILGVLFMQFRRHESIHLFTRVDQIEVRKSQATARVFAAMAGRPIPRAEDLPALRADLYRFDLALTEERGEWQVTRSSWRPAVLRDFFPPPAD
jgi:hypothetical protein